MGKKILVIRFSSFGDIVQSMSLLGDVSIDGLRPEIHWVTRAEFKPLLESSNLVDHIYGFDRAQGLMGLIKLALELRRQKYYLVYDAHSNTRSRILCFILRPFFLSSTKIVRRSKERLKRILLFKFRKNLFPKPYRGMMSFRAPLEKLGLLKGSGPFQEWKLPELERNWSQHIALCPSAAWEMKRWPLGHWKKLIEMLPEKKFVILGGPKDDFCQQLEEIDPARITNTAGKLSLIESCSVIQKSPLTVSADTGLIHVAEILGKPGISLVGPTAFGFPSHDNIHVMELDMACRPCTKDGRGSCSQEVWQACMVGITPEMVAKKIQALSS